MESGGLRLFGTHCSVTVNNVNFNLPVCTIKSHGIYSFFRNVRRETQLLWRHNGYDGTPNHQPYDYLFNCSFRHRSKKKSKLRVTDICVGKSPDKWPVTRKMFPFDDVIRKTQHSLSNLNEFYKMTRWLVSKHSLYQKLLRQKLILPRCEA